MYMYVLVDSVFKMKYLKCQKLYEAEFSNVYIFNMVLNY